MKNSLCIAFLVLMLVFTAYGQRLGKPTLAPTLLTAAQQKMLQEGVNLHDAKKYDEAIAKYRSILVESPDCAAAMYELSLSLNSKGEKLEAVETAYRGSKYISDELPLFYVLIANNLDDQGKPDDAIKIYRDGLKLLEGDTRFANYRSSLYFNLGVTQIKLKKLNDARQSLKNAVESNFSYASPNFQLAYVFANTNYKMPAFLAACRFVSLEYNTNRTTPAAATIVNLMKPPAKDPRSGNTVINLDFGGPTEEGDFGSVNLLLPMMLIPREEKDNGTAKTDNELFYGALDTAVGLLASDKKLASTFVGKTYIPFMADMKRSGHLEAFGYMVIYLSGKKDALTWLDANEVKLRSLIAWAQDYRLPTK